MNKSLALFPVLLALSQPAFAKCSPSRIETDINAIRLGDEISVERTLGKIGSLPIGANNSKPSESDFPDLVLYNKSRTEMAVLTKHPGDTPGSFMEIEVRSAKKPELIGKTLSADHLLTEKGIGLGVTEAFVTQRLGACFTKTNSADGATLEYALEDMNHPYLKRVNMPSYYGRYTFRDGKLVAFAIGSEYP